MSLSNLPIIGYNRKPNQMQHIAASDKYFAEAFLFTPCENMGELLDSIHQFKGEDKVVNAILVNWLVCTIDEFTQLPSYYQYSFRPEKYCRPSLADQNENCSVSFEKLLGYNETQAVEKVLAQSKHINPSIHKMQVNIYKKI